MAARFMPTWTHFGKKEAHALYLLGKDQWITERQRVCQARERVQRVTEMGVLPFKRKQFSFSGLGNPECSQRDKSGKGCVLDRAQCVTGATAGAQESHSGAKRRNVGAPAGAHPRGRPRTHGVGRAPTVSAAHPRGRPCPATGAASQREVTFTELKLLTKQMLFLIFFIFRASQFAKGKTKLQALISAELLFLGCLRPGFLGPVGRG